MIDNKFKYEKQIRELMDLGCTMPELYAPKNISACRFAFSDLSRQNHIPQYVSQPKRMLQDISCGKATTSLIALSCFSTSVKAEAFYDCLRKSFRKISSTIGDSLSEGVLANDDGKKTETADNGHFDFYEYIKCDLNKTFKITKQL